MLLVHYYIVGDFFSLSVLSGLLLLLPIEHQSSRDWLKLYRATFFLGGGD